MTIEEPTQPGLLVATHVALIGARGLAL